MSVRVGTFDKWVLDVDVEKKWLACEKTVTSAGVTLIFCKLCKEHSSSLRGLRNYSKSFVDGVTGTALKKDNVVKHSQSDMHAKALGIASHKAKTLSEIYKTTPIGKALVGATAEERNRVAKLFEIAYFTAIEEIPFSKFPGIVELEKRHGVSLGSTYHTRQKCSDFTEIIADTMQEPVLAALKKADYFSLLVDGSTDSSVTEKELTYVAYLGSSGEAEVHFLAMKYVQDATAAGLVACITDTFQALGIDDWQKKLVSVCMDGAAVNLGVRRGVAARLRVEMPWLVGIHCFNHRLELAAKDAFAKTYIDDVTTMLTNLYYMYHKSPKRLRDLQALADELEENVVKPQKVHGTRWLQHKRNAIKALLRSYPVIVQHIQELSDGNTADCARFKAYLKQLSSFKFVSHVLLFDMILTPLAALSLNLQSSSVDLQFALSSLASCRAMVERVRTSDLQGQGQLADLLEKVHAGEEVTFKGVNLTGTAQTSVNALHNARDRYAEAVHGCLQERFSDLDQQDVFKAVKILNCSTWPEEEEALRSFGTDTVLAVHAHFARISVADGDAVILEWDAFKSFWQSSCSSLSSSRVWSLLLTKCRDQYPTLCLVLEPLLVLPVSNAVVERGFSTMRRVKTDWRCRLSESTLDNLMRISLEGSEPSKFDVTPAVNRFFSMPRRPNVQP